MMALLVRERAGQLGRSAESLEEKTACCFVRIQIPLESSDDTSKDASVFSIPAICQPSSLKCKKNNDQ